LATDPLDLAEEDTDIYSDDEKRKKIVNKIIDYTLGKGKLTRKKLKVKRLRIKHRVIIIPGNPERDRKKN
jgi:hypothetical protein